MDLAEPTDASACKVNFQFIEDIVTTHLQYVQQLRRLLQKGYGVEDISKLEVRNKRANPLFMGIVGGIFGALSTELFARLLPDDQLEAAASKTEEILNTLGERTNALDINQKRIYLLLEQIQQQLNNKLGTLAGANALSNTHMQINSILIHVNEHLGYLYRLLAGGDTDTGINLAISEEERTSVIERTANQTRKLNISAGKPIKHRFQFLAPETLCLIMDIPIKPSITSVAVVETMTFPTIKNGVLWAPIPRSKHFLHFSGGYFVEVSEESFAQCSRKGTCTGMLPLQYADDTVSCHVAQYFGEFESRCSYVNVDKRRFLTQSGRKLAYTLLKPLIIRLKCRRMVRDMVRKLVGRGVMDIPMGCTAITNKAIFTEVKPAYLILEQNISLPLPSFPNLNGYNIQQINPLKMDLYPTNLKQEGTQLIGSGRTWGLSAIIAAIGVTTLLLFSIISYIVLFRKIVSAQRRVACL